MPQKPLLEFQVQYQKELPNRPGYLNGHYRSQAEYNLMIQNCPYCDSSPYTLLLHDPFL